MEKVIVNKDLLETLLNLASVVEARDLYTGGHIWRVSQYSRMLAETIGLSNEEIMVAELGGLIHDLGKIGISDSVLNKDGPLDDFEYSIMKTHTTVGKSLIETHPLAPIILDAVHNHHERIDGRGYPSGAHINEKSIFSNITGIADAFDAMTSTRAYRSALSTEEALKRIREGFGTQFDEKLAQLFIDMDKNNELDHIVGHFNNDKELLECPVCGPIISYDSKRVDGDHISCASCSNEFVMHKSNDSFVLESRGVYNPLGKTNGDRDIIIYLKNNFLNKITI